MIPFYNFGIFLFMCNTFASADKKKCTSQFACVDKGVETCSYCVDDEDGQNGQCMYIYPKTYISSPSCVKYDDKSCPLKCSRRGDCLTSTDRKVNSPYYHPYCRCSKTSFGEGCQYDNVDRQPVFSYVKHLFDFKKPISACESTLLQFTFHSWTARAVFLTSKFEIYVKVGDLSFKEYPMSLLQSELNSDRYRATLVIKAVFPYKPLGECYKHGDRLIGYHTSVKVNIFRDNQIAFDNSWGLFVRYEYLICLPKIYTNCAGDMMAPTRFLRSDWVEIDIDVKYIDDGLMTYASATNAKCKVSEKMSCKIWKLSNGRSSYLPLFEHPTLSNRISYNPHSLQVGIYEVLVEVVNVGMERSVRNVAHCYFKVTCVPLVAKIVGGSDRMVSANLGLLLNADKSYDPNMPSYDQGHLNIEWSCVNLLNPEKRDSFCNAKQLKVSEDHYVPSNLLTPGGIYNFTLKVWTDIYDQMVDCSRDSVSPQFAFVIIKVAQFSDTDVGDVVIECFKNCGPEVVPSNELFLKASLPSNPSLSTNTMYEWHYYKNEEEKTISDSIRIDARRSYLLIIKEDSLEPGSSYTIVARIENSDRYAKYDFRTYSIDLEVNYTLEPESGIKGFTKFKINCVLKNKPTMASLTFEFYDKYEDEKVEGVIYNGRMLGTSKEGRLSNVRLTRGNVLIYVVSDTGMLYLSKHINVTLRDWVINNNMLHEMYQDVANEIRFGSIQSALGAISFIPDIIPESMNNKKSDIFDTLLGFVTQLPIEDFGNMKLSASTLTNILLTMNKPKQLHLKPHQLAAVFRTIKQGANIFTRKILAGELRSTSPKEVKQVAVSLLNCLQAGMSCREEQTEGIPEGAADMSVLRDLRQGSSCIEAVIDLISNALSYVQVPGQPVTKISSKSEAFVIWVMKCDETLTITELLSTKVEVPVVFSIELLNNMQKRLSKNENLALQVVAMEDNIYWWSLSDVRSKLVSVSLNKQNNNNNKTLPIQFVDEPMGIFINLNDNLKNTKVQEFTSTSDIRKGPFSLESGIKIHRFDPAVRSLMAIQFLYPPTNGSLYVLVMEHFRPDHEIMLEEAKVVSANSPEYKVPYYDYDEPYFLYMGVMSVIDSQSVRYTFEISTTACNVWSKGQWSSAGCRVRRVDRGKRVLCECTHFSVFAAAFPFPVNSVDPFEDTPLFLTVVYNPLVVVCVIILLLMYLLECLHLKKSAKSERHNSSVIILEDNFSHDKVPYLVAVFTGPRLNAGTTSHVGIRLIGTIANSRPHILRSKNRTVLKTNSDDWFLIYCPEHLGDVEGIHIWHDNSGSSPDWLCDKVFVYDLLEKTETLFVIDEWLALDHREFPEIYILSAAIDDIINIKTLLLYNILLSIRESHALLSFVVCHPRSEMPRIHRLNIFMCSLFTAMLSSIIFYVPKGDLVYFDTYQYSIETTDFFISVQSLFISVTICFFVYFLFKKSYKITYTKHKNILRVRHHDLHNNPVIYTFENKQRECTGGTLYRNFLKFTNHIVRSNTMEPVQLPNHEPILKVQKKWLILSWGIYVTIIGVCSYLLMLHGLKFGAALSEKWMTSALFAACGDVLFLAPIRVLFMSTMVAISLQKMFDLDVHDVGVSDLGPTQTSNDPEYNQNVIRMRKNSMYKPLRRSERNKMLAREKVKRRRSKVLDFLINIVMLVVLKNLILELWITHFSANSHVIKMITLTKHEVLDNIDLLNLPNISSFEEYLRITLVNCLYSLRWYNGRPLHSDMNHERSEYWASDYTLRLLGLPEIRQIRVVPKSCDNILLQKGQCIPRWSSESEDKDDYGDSWKAAMWSDVARNNSPWRYFEKIRQYKLTRLRLYSPSGVSYPPGGYLVVLGPTRKDTELKVAELVEYTWINSQTRAIFVEFSMYNVNLHLFIRVTLMVENLSSGTLLSKAHVFYFRTGTYLDIWNVLFVAITLYYLCRCVHKINRHGITQFLSHFSNVCKLLIVSLGSSTLVLIAIHYEVSTYYLEMLHTSGFNNFIYYDSLANCYFFLRSCLSLLLFVSALHATSLLKGGKSLERHFHTLFLSRSCIFWLTLSITTIIISLICIFRYLNHIGHYNLEEIIINKKSLGYIKLNEFENLHVQLLVLIKIVSITICLWLFMIHFMFSTKMA